MNIDGSRIGTDGGTKRSHQAEYPKNAEGKEDRSQCWARTGHDVIEINKGRWPANLILSHSPDCVCVGTKEVDSRAGGNEVENSHSLIELNSSEKVNHTSYGIETVEVYACIPDCPIRIMDEQSGKLKSGNLVPGHKRGDGTGNSFMGGGGVIERNYGGDSGGASRFFYCAKSKRSEKEAGLMGFAECVKCGRFDSKTHIIKGKKENCTRNNHPTVKPVELMKYLCNLIKMPNKDQVILDPFCGSGSTLVALEQLGINYIGIDQDSDSCLTAIARIGA